MFDIRFYQLCIMTGKDTERVYTVAALQNNTIYTVIDSQNPENQTERAGSG